MIGFYCSSTSWGGLEMNFVRYATWLKNKGYNVLVFCVKDSPIAKHVLTSELNYVYVKKNKKYYDLKNANKISKLVRKHGIKAMWLRDTRDFSTIGLAKTITGNKFKIIYQQAMQLGVKKKDLLHTLRFSKIDAWISLLDVLANQVKEKTKFNPNKIHTIPLAVKEINSNTEISKEESKERFGIKPNVFLLGMIGRFSPKKGHLFVIEELAKIRKEYQNIELLIVGESTKGEGDEYLNSLKETIQKHGLNNVVHFHPYLKEVEYFYKASDLFIMASEGETFGNVTIEAMSYGTPILGTNAAGTPEILDYGNLGYLYEVNDHTSFNNQIKSIIKQPDLLIEKARKAQKIANEKYSKESVLKQIESLLEKLKLSDCKTK